MDKFTVTKEIEFDCGHRVPNHKSKCRFPHGHRYKVRVTVEGPVSAEEGSSGEGMVMDFGDIKLALTVIHDTFDHGFAVYEHDLDLRNALAMLDPENLNMILTPYIPTAENFAKDFYLILANHIADPDFDISVKYVEVYETPTSVARYPA